MTNPPGPESNQPPAYTPPPAYPAAPPVDAQQQYAPPAYNAAPPAPAGGAPATIPGKTLGIVALIVSIFANVIGLILGIVALVQSKKAGYKNGPAVAAIIVGSVLFVIGIIVAIAVLAFVIPAALDLAEQCLELGPGTHEINGVLVTCTAS